MLKKFAEAADAGYRLTGSDWEKVEEAYPKATGVPKYRIKKHEDYLNHPGTAKPFGENSEPIYDQAKKALEEMVEWYRKCKNARQ